MERKIFHSDKILKHLGRVKSWMEGSNPYPITVEFDMTNQCNHACPGCIGTANKDKSDHLSKKRAKDIIYELGTLGIKGLMFSGGGEPLMHPYTIDMVTRAAEQGIDAGFITNGTLLDDDSARILVDNCKWIRISLDADGPEMYKMTHGVDEDIWHRTLANIKMLVDTKRREETDVTIGIGFLTSEKTAPGMLEATRVAKELGVDYIQFRAYYNDTFDIGSYNYFSKCQELENEQFKVVCSYSRCDEIRKYNRLTPYYRGYDKCYGHQFATVIGADAKVYLCCHMRGKEEYVLGDLNTNSFWEIWHSDRRKEVIEKLTFKDCIPFCRCDPFNKILWQLKKEREHVNFL